MKWKKSGKLSNRNWAGTTTGGSRKPNATGKCGKITTPHFKKTGIAVNPRGISIHPKIQEKFAF
jgi:hypothetical protein